MKNYKTKSKGFTLLEILLVVGIIAILAGIVIIAINPNKQLAMARNTERKSDLKQINNALQQYYIDHREYPEGLTDTLTDICDTGDLASSSVEQNYCDDLIDLSILVPTYLTAIPKDPQATTTNSAGYKVKRHSSGGTIGLSAPAELGQDIVINIPQEVVDACGISGDATDPDCWSSQKVERIWGPYGLTDVSDDINIANGKSNTAVLYGRGSDYEAAYFCYTLTEGDVPIGTWYLPSYKELWDGWITFGFDKFSFAERYWSSTKPSEQPDAFSYVLITISNNMNYGNKSFSYSVRCLR